MPRKTKEQKELENNENLENVAKKTTRKTTKKNNSDTTTKKASNKKSTSSAKKTTTKKTATTTKKAKSKNEADTTKKTTTRKRTSASTKKTSTAKKSTTKKSTPKEETTTSKEKASIVEYYDLPYRYNQTVVKVLAQTPTNLFIYWDISDEDKENYKKQYGERFFEETKPVLIVHNKTFNYSFEIDINDFANSWYLHVNDAKCDYAIELGRRPIVYNKKINTDYVYISTSNEIESPNDRVLFNKDQKMVYFRNVKTGNQIAKPITSLSFIRNMGRIYNIYDLYKEFYQEEDIENLFDLSNPSSGNPSSGTFSSKFK